MRTFHKDLVNLSSVDFIFLFLFFGDDIYDRSLHHQPLMIKKVLKDNAMSGWKGS